MYILRLGLQLSVAAMLFNLTLTAVFCADDERPRLMVLTDIGGDPDDQQSLVRLMVYSNAFRIEGLIATASGTPGELKRAITRPDLIEQIVKAYDEVRANLTKHADGWPETQFLLDRIKSGNPQRGRAHIGAEHDTEGSKFLVERIDAGKSEDPLNITIWGGQTDLAQSLWRVKHERSAAEYREFVSRFRVYDIADQDGLADWIAAEFPGLFYILSKHSAGNDKRSAAFRGMYLTGDESLTSKTWIEANVLSTGALGKLYPTKTWTAPNPHSCLKEGDTPSWFFFLPLGHNDPDDPTQPGWGGQFRKSAGGWYRDEQNGIDPRNTVSRWRPEFQADFSNRMAWTKMEF
jgi:hypothetical protein